MLAFLRRHAPVLPWPFFALFSLAFYSIPLFSRNATIHWDLADVYYPAQKFFAASVHAWKLPHWTPYLDSGIPFLADPRTGAWYPLHWPFFLTGVITPRTMLWELALHAFIASAGAYLLARKLFDVRGAAMLGAMLYGFGGFFAAHSSALPAFEAAAWLPWLLWGALKALDSKGSRWIAFTALIGGLIVLAGDALTAAESLLALVCVALVWVAMTTRQWGRAATLIVSVAILAVMLGAIQIVPAIELYSQSHPPTTTARFHFGILGTLISADYYNLINGLYSGPDDPREFYLYSGLLLTPLAISGFVRRQHWPLLLAIIAPTVVFEAALRPAGDAWFAAGLGLAITAASGVVWVETRMARPYIWAALVVLSAVDLWFWNLYKNPLVFAHATFSDIYGQSEKTANKNPLARTYSPYPPLGLGPANGPLITRTEATYGTGLAELDRYRDYMSALEKNTKLLNGLGVTDLLFGRGRRIDNPASLGRVSIPPHLDFVADRTAANAALAKLDPDDSALVEARGRRAEQHVDSVAVTAYTGDFYRIEYSAASDSLFRVAVPHYPGWTATIDGKETGVVPVDEALLGVFVPAGQHDLVVQFEARRFSLGVSLSAVAAIAVVIGLILI